MADHHIVPKFLISRWKGDDGRVTLADLEELVVRDAFPKHLDARPNFNRLGDHEDPEALERAFFGGLESDAARAVRQLVTVGSPLEHVAYARANGYRPGQVLRRERAVRFMQFMAAQVVRSPDWRTESNAHTAAEIAEELEVKIRADLEATDDPSEIQRLESMLGLRHTAFAQGDMLPQLSAALATSIGQVLYCEYVPTVVRVAAPILCLGNDPVIFMDEDPAINIGSYSQIAARRGTHPFSVRRDIDSFMAAAIDIARGHRLIAMPLDPEHAIVLHSVNHARPPGMYTEDLEFGQLLNSAATKASRRWLVVPSGRREAAREAVYLDRPQLRTADRHRAERGMPLHTNPHRARGPRAAWSVAADPDQGAQKMASGGAGS